MSQVSEWFQEHGPRVWRTLARFGVPASDLEDALQETFVVAHRRSVDYDPTRAAPTTWLLGIAYRVAADFRRKAKRYADPHQDDDRIDPAAGPEGELVQKQQATLLAEALEALGEEKRAAFVLYEIEELECPEIAQILSVPLGTVHSRLHQARADLEKFLSRADALDDAKVRRR